VARLLFSGSDASNRTYIDSISCTIGRTSITEQPSPATFTCQIGQDIETSTYFDGIQLGEIVEWYLDDPLTGGDVRVFYGEVTDITILLDQWGAGSGIRTYSVQAVGMSGALNRQLTNSNGYVKQYSGDRIYTILANADWQGSAYDVTYIDGTNVYEIIARNDGYVSSLAFAQEAANSAMGCLYEDHKNGWMVYQTYSDRPNNTEIVITIGDILASSFSVNQSTTDIANRTSVTYGSSGASSGIYNNTTSQGIYGIKEGVKETTLHNLTDAQSIAQILLASRNLPEFNLTSITIDTAAISDSLRQELLNVHVGTRIFVTDLPSSEIVTFEGFIEGYSWSSSREHDRITMNLSNYGNNYPYTLWNQLNGTDTWNTYATSTTKWSDII
jgi:hypothetical protein